MVKKSRKTKQKELIKAEINAFTSLFTAEELFNKVRKKDADIGIATIYRFLKDLRKERELHSYICDRRMIYSGIINFTAYIMKIPKINIPKYIIDLFRLVSFLISGMRSDAAM